MSLGFPVARHSLPYKLYLAASHGFKAVEMYYPCLEHYANNLALPEGTSFRLRMKEASRRICELCKELDLKIICLQPFMQYEGLINTQEHADKLKDAAFRMEVSTLPLSRGAQKVNLKNILSAAVQPARHRLDARAVFVFDGRRFTYQDHHRPSRACRPGPAA